MYITPRAREWLKLSGGHLHKKIQLYMFLHEKFLFCKQTVSHLICVLRLVAIAVLVAVDVIVAIIGLVAIAVLVAVVVIVAIIGLVTVVVFVDRLISCKIKTARLTKSYNQTLDIRSYIYK